jgi:hypothetical protein
VGVGAGVAHTGKLGVATIDGAVEAEADADGDGVAAAVHSVPGR